MPIPVAVQSPVSVVMPPLLPPPGAARLMTPPLRTKSVPENVVEICAGGLLAAYFRVSGHTFDRKDPTARLSFTEAQQLHVITAVDNYDRGREGAESEWAWERWHGTCEPREVLVVRESAPIHRWMLDQLAIVRSDDRVRVGYVTRVAIGGEGELGAELQLSLAIRLWSARPAATTLLPLSAAGSNDPPLAALRHDDSPDDKPFLVLPPRTFNPSRVLRSLDTGPDRRYRLTRLLQRGVDFERASFEETS